MLAAVLLIALSMAAGAYHTEAATQVSSQAIVLTQKTSVGGKLFFVIDVQKLRQSYPQAVAVNLFMDTNAFASIGSTSVPLIYDSQYYAENGVNLTVPYAEHLKLDTSGVGENLLIVSLPLPADNSWWAKVSEMTGVNYASASAVYLKIQIDQNTVAVMDGHFSLSNKTIVGKYQISDTKFSYTGFNATWYGGPATTNETTGSIQLFHADGTPLNLTAGDASWIKYQVEAYNPNNIPRYLFNITITPSGVINNESDMFYNTNATYVNTSTSQVKFSLQTLQDFPVNATGTETKGGVEFPYSEFQELLYTVQISPIEDEHYNNSFNSTNDIVIVNLTTTSYLNLTLVNTNTVFAMGELSNGITGTLTYYTYNSTADEFENPAATPASYSVDYVFNQTSDQAYVVYLVNWNEAPPLKVYPSVTLEYNETHIVEGTDTILGNQMNPGDFFVITGHNLPYPANFSTVCLAGWNGENFTIFSTEVYTPGTESQVGSDGTLTATVYVANHPYGGNMFYPILRVNVTGTLYRTWVDDAQGMKIYPYVTAEYLDNDGYFMGNTVDGQQLAPGDYILIKGYGFITTEDLTPFVSYDTSNITNALHALITLTNVQGLDTNGDGMIDAYKVKNDTTGEIALVVKLPADINMTKLASGFVFGLKGSGDNVGFSNVTADSVAYGVGNDKVFLWPYGDNVARFFGNTTSLEIFSYLNDLTVYPYEAYEYIQGVEKSDVMAYVEIVGFPMYDNGTVDVNLEDGMFYKVTSFNATDLVQGYKELAIKVPTLPSDYYYAYVNESNSTSYYYDQYSSYALNISCIIGYKVSGSSAYQMLTGTVTARPGANVTFIGYGFDANSPVEIDSLVPALSPSLASTTTDDYGTFNTTISTSYLLQLTGRDGGVFQLELYSSPCSQTFSLIVSEKPLFKISVKADPNAFVGDTIYVSVKLLLEYKTEEVPMLSQPASVAQFQYLTLWFIYGPGDVKVINITDLSAGPVVYVNPTTSEIVISYIIDHHPANDVLVVDALAGASIFGGYFNSVATDHAVVSVDSALSNMINNVATLAGEAKTSADNAASAAQNATTVAQQAASAASDAKTAAQQAASAASDAKTAAQQAASAASDAKTAASNAASAAQQAASAAQNAATAASGAQKSASDTAQKVTTVGDNLSKEIQDVSNKVGVVGSKTGSGIKTYGLINMILIIITLIVALYLVAKMRP